MQKNKKVFFKSIKNPKMQKKFDENHKIKKFSSNL